MRRVDIVLGQATPDFGSCYPHHRVGGDVVVRVAPEYLHPDAALFESRRLLQEALLNDITKQGGIALALAEQRMRKKPLQLGSPLGHLRGRFLFFCFREHSQAAGRFDRMIPPGLNSGKEVLMPWLACVHASDPPLIHV